MLDGYLGIINFGYAAFFGAGAYASAVFSLKLSLPITISILCGGFIAALLGFAITMLCLRMGAFSVAMVTLAFGEAIRICISLWDSVTGGSRGLWGIPPLFEGPSRIPYFYVILLMCMIMIFSLRKIIYSDLGLIFRSIREDDLAASTLGVNITKYRLLGSSISCFMAGVTGGFYGHYILTITPAICGIGYTVPIIAFSLIGGRGTFWGPIIGAFSLTLLGESIRFLESFRLLIYGLLMIAVVIVFPNGLVGLLHHLGTLFRKLLSKSNPVGAS
jgi:branched-chain amino acid transport system permease protein